MQQANKFTLNAVVVKKEAGRLCSIKQPTGFIPQARHKTVVTYRGTKTCGGIWAALALRWLRAIILVNVGKMMAPRVVHISK